jgi:hypothetical protein
MPIKKVRLEDLEAEVETLEAKHRILEIGYPNDAHAVIRFETRGKRTAPGDVETRA